MMNYFARLFTEPFYRPLSGSFFAIAIFLFFIATVTGFAPAHGSPAADYVCDVKPHPLLQRDGYLLGERIYLMNDDFVGLTGYAEQRDQLPRVRSGSGMQFSNGAITFGAKGDEGFIELYDGTLFPCHSATASIIAPATALGTVVRVGPSKDAAKIETLPEGEPVSLLKEAGAYIGDFQWFKIEYSEGLQGFAWGGTMCVDTELAGILIDCHRFVSASNNGGKANTNGGQGGSKIFGQSLFGSKIREGADPGARQIASIGVGSSIEILQETGSFYDGWQWLRIRYGSGKEGYVWGGTICVTQGVAPTGVHATCN